MVIVQAKLLGKMIALIIAMEVGIRLLLSVKAVLMRLNVSLMSLLSAGSFVVLSTFSSWFQDGCRTPRIRSSHTALKVRNGNWHRHGVCPHVLFSDQKRNIFPKLWRGSPHTSHWWEFSFMATSKCNVGKRTPDFLDLCTGGQTREKDN